MSDASFCIYCMSELNERTELNAPEVITKRRARFIIVCAFIAFCLIFVLVRRSPNNTAEEQTAGTAEEQAEDLNADMQPAFDFNTLSAASLSSLSRAQKIESGSSVDIDGDGGKEIIEFNAGDMQNITINGNSFNTDVEDAELPADFEVYIGNVDASDNYTEVFITQTEYKSGLNTWLYAYRFDGSELMPLMFNGDLLVADNSGNIIYVPTAGGKRAHMPGDPIYLTGTGAIGWRDEYSAAKKDVYRFFELRDNIFTETEKVILHN